MLLGLKNPPTSPTGFLNFVTLEAFMHVNRHKFKRLSFNLDDPSFKLYVEPTKDSSHGDFKKMGMVAWVSGSICPEIHITLLVQDLKIIMETVYEIHIGYIQKNAGF